MNWTWLGLAVLVLLAFSMVDGYRHGFVKEVVSALLVLISVALVWMMEMDVPFLPARPVRPLRWV